MLLPPPKSFGSINEPELAPNDHSLPQTPLLFDFVLVTHTTTLSGRLWGLLVSADRGFTRTSSSQRLRYVALRRMGRWVDMASQLF